MDLIQLKYFKTLADTQHMTQAANTLHIAQPALSRCLRNLEAELGMTLFDRNGRNISLNDNGAILLQHTNAILNELKDLERELSDKKEQKNKHVTISMFAASKLLPGLIRGFRQHHPNITLQIIQQNIFDSTEQCDITIYSSSQPAAEQNAITLMEEEICLALPTTNPLCKRKSIKLKEVANEPFICLYKGIGLRTVTDEYCQLAGFLPQIVLESDSPGTVRELIALGVGLAFIPKISWSNIRGDSNIVLVDIEEPQCKRYINMIMPKNRYISKASILLRNYLIEFFSKLTYPSLKSQ